MPKKNIVHTDILGQEIAVGSIVALGKSYNGRKLSIARVVTIHPKMIGVQIINTKFKITVYPTDTIIVTDNPNLTLFLLRDGK